MGKYEPLQRHLGGSGPGPLRLSFAEVESILGFPLPESAREYPAWWSNNARGHSHSRAWLDEGWQSQEVDLANETVTFVRTQRSMSVIKGEDRRKLFGSLKGTVRIAQGVDLTSPTGEKWRAEDGRA